MDLRNGVSGINISMVMRTVASVVVLLACCAHGASFLGKVTIPDGVNASLFVAKTRVTLDGDAFVV